MPNVLYVRCPPAGAVLRFLNGQNQEINLAQEALNVSNHVSDDADLPVNAGFNATSGDPDNFRLEVEHPRFTGASVTVDLKIGNREGLIRFTLNKKDSPNGRVFRGDFLRLVTDESDIDHAKAAQAIVCTLGEQIHFFYSDHDICTDVKIIRVGRPPTSGQDRDNGANQLRHDIRELKLNVIVMSRRGTVPLQANISATQTTIPVHDVTGIHGEGWVRIDNEIIKYTGLDDQSNELTACERGAANTTAAPHCSGASVAHSMTTPAVTLERVQRDLQVADERLAQSAIRLKRPVVPNMGGTGDPGRVLPPALLNGIEVQEGYVTTFTNDELALMEIKDTDANSVDIFYVESYTGSPNVAEAYPRVRNQTNPHNDKGHNFVIITAAGFALTLAHELMHILLNSPHRTGEPTTALFYAIATQGTPLNGPKRIGPYPAAAAAGVGNCDTKDIRTTAEALPN